MDNAMSIPEIVERILSFLPQQSLCHVASLVCKDWLRLCRPLYALTFQWTDCPQYSLVPVPLEPSARGSSRLWSLRKFASSSSTAHTLVRIIPERTWLLKKLVGLTTLKCRLNYRSPVTAMTIAPRDDEESMTTTTAASSTTTTITTTATTARMVSTQIAHLQDKARMDLIESIRTLTKQGKLTLLQLELSELDDFSGFLRPILSIATTLSCLWLKKIGIQQLPIGQILTLCPYIEELTIGCEFYSSRAKLTMVLLDEVDCGQEEQRTHSLPKYLQLKRLHLKDVLIKESAILAILESAPGLYELRVHGPVIPPPTPPITPSATVQHGFTLLDVPSTVPVGADHAFIPSTAAARGMDLRGDWLTCDRLAFFEDLGALFPQLTSLHFTRTHHWYTDTMIRGILRAFPNASKWSIAWRDMPDGNLRDLNQCVEASSVRQIDSIYWAPIQEPLGLYANHLTSLELLPMTDWTPRWGNALHEFLCESPLLEHLRAGSISYHIENLDLNGLLPGADDTLSDSRADDNINSHNNDQYREHDQASVSTHSTFERHYFDAPPSSKKTLKVWACRNLKTLHLEFSRERPKTQPNQPNQPVSSYTNATSISNQSFSTRSSSSSSLSPVMVPLSDNSPRLSRIVYGYISRFCPNLQDLLIRAFRLNMTLRGGFVLLTRLRKLKRVAISQYDCHFNERDMLPWVIKRRQSLSGIQTLQWKAIVAGWWRVLHAKELGPTTSPPLSLQPPVTSGKKTTTTAVEGKGKQKEGCGYQEQQHDHSLVRPSPPSSASIKKLGYLSDVVDVLTEIMADRSSAMRDLRQEGLTGLVEDCKGSVWPELECVRIVHGQMAKSGIKEGAIRAVLKKHRPEVEFQWVSWINQL
ncbi:hypothetical protein EC957_002658 [Mortierella hygrophila]|uniref:F-box domain-containing protein n=1 Tax=Mortierella hygrophila TaxID=979708 RepID=A0A9P6F3W6_9FUNG|nr:hypothetical protein EC957_002658 [Mortierella hygrophila]